MVPDLCCSLNVDLISEIINNWKLYLFKGICRKFHKIFTFIANVYNI